MHRRILFYVIALFSDFVSFGLRRDQLIVESLLSSCPTNQNQRFLRGVRIYTTIYEVAGRLQTKKIFGKYLLTIFFAATLRQSVFSCISLHKKAPADICTADFNCTLNLPQHAKKMCMAKVAVKDTKHGQTKICLDTFVA